MRGRSRGLGNYTLGDRYTTPERRLSQMLTQKGSRGGPSDSWQETMGRIAQQLAGAYIGYKDQKNQNVANQAFTKAEPDSYSMQPTMNDQQIMESDSVQNILRQNTDADRMKNPMIQRNMNVIGYEQDALNQKEAKLNSLDPNNFMTTDAYNTEVKTLNDAMGRATQNIENYGDEFNQTMGRLNSQEPTDDQRADAVGRELLGQRKASEVNTLNEKKPQLEYAMQNLRGLENNPYAQRLLQGLMMNQMDTNAASRLAQTQRGYDLTDVQNAQTYKTSERLAGQEYGSAESKKKLDNLEAIAKLKANQSVTAIREYRQAKDAGLIPEGLSYTDYLQNKSIKVLNPLQEEQLKKTRIENESTLKGQGSALESLRRTIRTGDQLLKHPGREMATGGSSFMSTIPGTDAKGFSANLDTFKSQNFLPAVQQMKGAGALSDAEGKKLTDAIGALDPQMPQDEFKASLSQIISDLKAAEKRMPGYAGGERRKGETNEGVPSDLPKADGSEGKTLMDQDTGFKWKSDGTNWKRVQ